MRKAGLEPASLSALAPKASVFAISPLPHGLVVHRLSVENLDIECKRGVPPAFGTIYKTATCSEHGPEIPGSTEAKGKVSSRNVN